MTARQQWEAPTFASVCTGIGAPEVAWTPLGWTPLWFAEIEPFPSSVLAHRWPHVPNLGDMTKLASYVRAGIVSAPDVLVGGTPCQAFSLAGLRAGLLDPRGQLTLAYVDLANAIDEKRVAAGLPESVVVWENVPGVLSDKANAFGCFLGLLAGEDDALVPPGKKWPDAGIVHGPQRAIAWRVLDAQYFGVAQRRRRVFVIASARKGFDPTTVLFEHEGLRRDSPPSRETKKDPAAGTLRSTNGGCDVDHARAGHLLPVAFGGNNQSGPIDVATALNACSSASGRLDFESETFVVSSLDASYARLQGCSGQDANHGHSHLVPVAFAIQAGALRENPASGPDGVGVQPDIAYTIEARAEVQAVAYRHAEPRPVWRVRRLMPHECERLQGFPDGHTLVPHRGKPAADGPRYKALGNSMCTLVMRWLGQRVELGLARCINVDGLVSIV